MLSDRERFLGKIMKGFDFIALALAFPVAYFFDEFIRAMTSLSVKAYAIGPTLSGFIYFASKYWMMFIGFPIIWISVLSVNNVYRGFRLRSFRKQAWIIFVSSIWASIACGSFIFLFKFELASRLFFSVYTITAYLMLLLEKRVLLYMLNVVHSKGYNQENLLIVGTGKRAREFIRAVTLHKDWGLAFLYPR
jgi:FlaA1/EpsC-like NDP-sugar epimerase